MFGLSYLRLGIYFVAACAMGYLIYQYRTGQEAKAQVVTITAERDKAINEHNAYVAVTTKQDSITKQTSTDYENAVQDLVGQLTTARAVHPDVRVCHNAAVPASNPTSPATSGPDEASKDGPSAAPDQVAGPNISDGLYEIAGEAAECGERLNHLQDWVKQQLAVSTVQ